MMNSRSCSKAYLGWVGKCRRFGADLVREAKKVSPYAILECIRTHVPQCSLCPSQPHLLSREIGVRLKGSKPRTRSRVCNSRSHTYWSSASAHAITPPNGLFCPKPRISERKRLPFSKLIESWLPSQSFQ